MNFDERNAVWLGGLRSFMQEHSRTTTPRMWMIFVSGCQVTTSWGQQGGVTQVAIETFQGVNIGKKNEMSPAAYALDRAKEMCRKKNWEGYREIDGTANYLDAVVKAEIDFDSLPLSLSFYKPDNSMGAGITKKAEAGKVYYSRKRNGLMYVIARGAGSAKLYSRRMLRSHDDETLAGLTWDHRFEHIIETANIILPHNSILLGELVMDREGEDDFKHVQSVTKSLTEQSLQDQAQYGRPSFYCWDIAFWRGEDLVRNWPVEARYSLIHELDGGHIIQPVEFFTKGSFPTPEAAVDYAKAKEWEGFVVVDPEGIYGDKAYNFKGKPDRPGTVCAKLKPEFEADFIAVWDPDKTVLLPGMESEGSNALVFRGERSQKERNDQGIKSVALYQFSARSLEYISNVSSGLTDEMKRDLADPRKWPRVIEVKYTERTYKSQGDDTNALTFARFSRFRDDKALDECFDLEL